MDLLPPLTCQVHRALDAGAEGSGIFFGCLNSTHSCDQTMVVGCFIASDLGCINSTRYIFSVLVFINI